MDFSRTKIRCSSLYNIMPDSRRKTPLQLFKEAVAMREEKTIRYEKMKKKDGSSGLKLLSELDELDVLIPKLESFKGEELPLTVGNKSFLAGVYSYEKYNKWSPSKDIGSRQTEKGREVEEDSIDLVSALDRIFLKKNEERVEDEWFSGLPDAFEGDNILNAKIIHDVKSPWDIETFFSYLGKPLPEQYYWQMQGYMAVTGAKVSEVHFCLVNTPIRFIKDAASAILRNMNVISELSPEYLNAEEELINNMTFDDIPKPERRIKFIVERNDEDIELARKRVEKCRLYLQEFENLHLNYHTTVSTFSQENKLSLIPTESQ